MMVTWWIVAFFSAVERIELSQEYLISNKTHYFPMSTVYPHNHIPMWHNQIMVSVAASHRSNSLQAMSLQTLKATTINAT